MGEGAAFEEVQLDGAGLGVDGESAHEGAVGLVHSGGLEAGGDEAAAGFHGYEHGCLGGFDRGEGFFVTGNEGDGFSAGLSGCAHGLGGEFLHNVGFVGAAFHVGDVAAAHERETDLFGRDGHEVIGGAGGNLRDLGVGAEGPVGAKLEVDVGSVVIHFPGSYIAEDGLQR